MGTRVRSQDVVVTIRSDADIIATRQAGRELAAQAGCHGGELTELATAISEVARNIVTYAGRGEVRVLIVEDPTRMGIEAVATDDGPGIADLGRALEDGYTTGEGLGLGLPGARRLMDEFHVSSAPGQGTTVVMRKWCTSSAGGLETDARQRGVA